MQVGTCPATDLGLTDEPNGLTDLDVGDGPHLPPDLQEQFSERWVAIGGKRAVLWLDVVPPSGFLQLLPWEVMLGPLLGCAVMRLPYFSLRPRTAQDSLTAVLCASSPQSKAGFPAGAMLGVLANEIVNSLPMRTRLELFVDIDEYEIAVSSTKELGNQVHVHDPRHADQHRRPNRDHRRSDSSDVLSPWLSWIDEALAGRAADVVHFLCHGYLAGDRGALALAPSPLAGALEPWSQFVGLTQLSPFLTRLGAWSFAVSGPPGNFSNVALRELGDALARRHPGCVIVHDTERDEFGSPFSQLADTYAFVYGPESLAVPRPIPAVTCWAHPRLVEGPSQTERTPTAVVSDELTIDDQSALIETASEALIAADYTPAWLASGTRILEQAQAQWMGAKSTAEPPTPGTDSAAAVGGLRAFADELEERAQVAWNTEKASAPGDEGSGGRT
ncbi:hypothetical protein AB5J56_00465 [Streptomyces sp. R21]|uniref:Uncharacterized protein n=1 Tax=Streptomyces sp. R21 TaxID=3238627 RepID=A0AB39NY08_9ACTN